jgi:L-lysine 2,3-aminomutase
MSNLAPPKEETLAFMRKVTGNMITQDMIQRGLTAYYNHQSMHIAGRGHFVSNAKDNLLIEEILRAALSGTGG